MPFAAKTIFKAIFVCVWLFSFFGVAARAQTEVETVGRAGDDSTAVGLASGFVLPVARNIEIFGLGAYVRGDARTKIALADVRFKVNKYLTVAPGYFGLFLPKTRGRRDYDHRVRLAATLNFRLGKLTISDRNLVERRFRASNDSTRYRNRLELQYPLKINRARFISYGNVEPFYDFNAGKITRAHFQLGVRKRFGKHFSGDAFYLHQSARGGADTNAFAFGVIAQLPKLLGKK